MFRITTTVLIIFTLLTKLYKCKNYHNYTLYRGIPVNEIHLEFLSNLSNIYDVNYWRPPGNLNKPIDFIISPEDRPDFLRESNNRGIYLTTVMRDVQRALDKQTVTSYIRRNMMSFNWESYFRLNDIYNWLKDLQTKFPKELTIIEIGRSSEGRRILAVRIALPGPKKRSTVIVEGGIHAREWISPAFVTYMINRTVTSPTSPHPEWKKIAATYEWYFMPCVNPDGYEYSHKEDRLWRKNRNYPSVDLNRNFDLAFGTVGVSNRKSSDIYCGPSALSEPETKAMSEFIRSHSANLEYYIGFHSYGQYMVLPYAHLKRHEDNFDEVKKLGESVSKTISRRFNKKYTVGTAYDTVGYRTSGVSGCWVKKTFQVPYVVTFELRDDGENGFALPPRQILPTCQETMDGMVTLLKPHTKTFRKLDKTGLHLEDGEMAIASDVAVLICNALLFLLVR